MRTGSAQKLPLKFTEEVIETLSTHTKIARVRI